MLKIAGIVIKGKQQGKKLGFPTANVEFEGEMEDGVYSGFAIVEGKKYKAGIMYRKGTKVLEACILDFSEEIYGKKIELKVGEKIREIIRFKTDEELIAQIKKDVELIRK